MDSVHKILENTRVNGDYHTHVSMIQPMGKFQISREKMDHFWNIYCNDIEKENEKEYEDDFEDEDYTEKVSYGIAEKVQTYIPILVDVDIKLPYDENMDSSTLYTSYQLESVVRDYQEVLKIILDKYTSENLYCFVLEKPAYRQRYGDNKEYIKNGFHLHFPYTFLSKNDHEAHLLPRIKKLLDKGKIFHSIGIEKSGDLVDASYLKNPWLLYGSHKVDSKAYKLSRILDEEREEVSLETALKGYKIYDKDENVIDITGRYEYFLPRVLSVVPWCRPICEVKTNLPSVLKIGNTSNGKAKDQRNYMVKNMTEIIEKTKKYLSILSDNRASSYNDWMQIGWALYNITNGSEDGMMLWLDFSSRCAEKFDEASCISEWKKMDRRNMTIGTIIHFAKEDNPIEFTKILQSYSKEHIKQSLLSGSHYDLAKVCFEYFGNEFVCVSIVKDSWYQFQGHRWKEIDGGVFLRKKISEDIVGIFNQKNRDIFEKLSKCSEEDKDMYNNEQKAIQKMISNLKQHPFKNNVMKECKEVFYNDKFMSELNKNRYLIGFRNGVYDLTENKFRPGIPEDYISMQMPIEYSEYSESDNIVREVYDFFEKVFPDKEIREYFMDISSEVFVGGNQRKKVFFWSGEGDNAKSVTQTFFEKMLGEYAVKLPTSLLTGKRTASSAASPELVRAGNGVRWVILQEPDKKEELNLGLLKELSGNDTFFARGLFSAGADIDPMFKITIICNDPPVVPHNDKAVWNRIRVIPFESTFSNDAPSSYEEQLQKKIFPKDPHFTDKIPSMAKAFAWVLLNHRKKGPKFVEPEKVKIATDFYKRNNDTYRQFVDERIMEVKSDKIRITLVELYATFKDWFRDSVPGKTVPTKNDVKEYYTKFWGEPTTQKPVAWAGKKFMSESDQLDKGDVLMLSEEDYLK